MMALSGCRLRRLLVHHRQRSGVSHSRSVDDGELRDAVLDSDLSDSFSSDDELFDATGESVHCVIHAAPSFCPLNLPDCPTDGQCSALLFKRL